MTTKESPITYLDALSRRNWSTWAWAAAIALAMNLTLFTIMPYLLHRQPAKPVYEQLVSHINVIRMKRPDSQVQRKSAKPPEKKEELPVWFKNSSVSQKLKIHHDFGKNHDEFCLEP
jgi:protein TonB